MPALLSPRKKMGRKRKEVDASTYTGRFALRLRMLREDAGMSVEELADKCGVDITTIYSWEAGKKEATIGRIPLLADALGVSIRVLMPQK